MFTIYICFVLLMLLHLPCTVYSQSNVWPQSLSIPQLYPGETQEDTISLSVNNSFSFFETLREENTVDWRRTDDHYIFNQQSNYSLVMYNRKSRDHSYALPGSFDRKAFPWSTSQLGLEWIPRLNYIIREDNGTYQSTVDLGPVLSSEMFTIPYKLRTGISADVWKEKIVDRSILSVFHDYSSDAGYYIGCDIGDESQMIHGVPLYVTLKATGRSVRNVGLGLLMANALFAHDLGIGDSLMLNIGDSLSNGKESFLSQGTSIETTPWRIVHGFGVGGGIKAAERLGFRPAGFYRYGVHSVYYPSDTTQVNDVRSTAHTINAQLLSIDQFFFNYSGGIECTWNIQDWVYKSNALPLKLGTNSIDVKKIQANNNDNTTFKAQMDHEIVVTLPAKMALEYAFHISRESRMFENYYISNGGVDTVWNQDEIDDVKKKHHIGIARNDSGGVSAGLNYVFSKSIIHYLREERSGSSLDRINHRIGAFVGLQYGQLSIKEEFSVQAEKSDYVFKLAHKGVNFDPPKQQRNLNSILTGSWMFNENYTFVCTWNEQYRDDGKWYGKEYLPDTVSSDYYAIQKKTNIYSIAMHLQLTFERLNALIGGSFGDTFSLRYSKHDNKYVSTNLDEGYNYKPYVQLIYQGNTFSVKGKVKREYNTIDPHRWSLYKNWDIVLVIQKEW